MAVSLPLGALATQFGLELKGDPETLITGVATLDAAQQGDVSFLANPKYISQLQKTQASAVILSAEYVSECPTNALIADNPKLILAQMLQWVSQKPKPTPGIHPSAVVSPNAKIGEGVVIGPYVVIGNSTIGKNVIIEAHTVIGDDCIIGDGSCLKARVTLYDDVTLGTGCLVHSGAVLGSDGFGFAQNASGDWEKVPQIGGVRIGNKVEIGANTTIDRGALSPTRIGNGVILDNLIQVGHNVEIGDKTAMAASTAIAGSTKIGQRCMIGGGCLIAGHISLADDVHVGGGTGVANHIREKGVYASGLTSRPYDQWRRNLARFHHLDELFKRVKLLEKSIEAL